MDANTLFMQYFPAARREFAAYHRLFTLAQAETLEPKTLTVHRYLRTGNQHNLLKPMHELGIYPAYFAYPGFLRIHTTVEHLLMGVSREHQTIFAKGVPHEDHVAQQEHLVDLLLDCWEDLAEIGYIVSVRRRRIIGFYPYVGRREQQWEISLAVVRPEKEGFEKTFINILKGS